MIIEDKVYGSENIRESVLVDLINSPSLQRLKGIAQFGIPDEYSHKKGFSRYEHSIGTFILLKKLNANLEEQIAGLIHDVSHTAFSHVVDSVIGNPEKEDYQDSIHKEFIKKSSIKNILDKYGFSFEKISKLENFYLLEKEAPSLCADRIDYCLRELILGSERDYVQNIFLDLEKKDNQIVFRNQKTAEIFAKEYQKMQKDHWGGDQARTRYSILSNVLKKALNSKIIFLEDLNQTDNYVLEKLNNSGDKFILENLNLLKSNLKIIEDKKGIELKKKFRYIDPEISVNGSFKKLSDLSKDYFDFINLEKQNSKQIKKVKYFEK